MQQRTSMDKVEAINSTYSSEVLARLIDNVGSMCRICAFDLKNKGNGIPIFNRDNLPEKIARYLYIDINSSDKMPDLICNDCAIKVDNFHNFALFAQKNQEIFIRINAEKTYQEHCKSLSSLNTTLYRETSIQSPTPTTYTIPEPRITIPAPVVKVTSPPLPPVPHHFEVASTEDITIFAYNDVKLGQVIKDIELLKLILRALQWEYHGNVQSQSQQLECLRNTSFRAVMTNPLLLQDEDLVQLLGPYLSKEVFGPPPSAKGHAAQQPGYGESSGVTEMEVGIDPALFFPYDDDESKNESEEIRHAPIQAKRTRKIVPKKRTPKAKTGPTTATLPQLPHAAAVDVVLDATKNKLPEVTILPEIATPAVPVAAEPKAAVTGDVNESPIKPTIRVRVLPLEKPNEQPQLVQRILQKSKQQQQLPTLVKPGRKSVKHVSFASEDVFVTPPVITAPILIPKPPSPAAAAPAATRKTKAKAKASTIITTTPATTRSAGKTKAYKCQICNKKYSTKGNLNVHMKTHKTKGKFTCDKCGRIFKTQINLQRHKDFHSKERFACRTCGRVYPSNSTLKQHEISHSNTRPHQCGICNKNFKRNQDLKFHLNQHTGEKPFKCPYCPRTFASSGNAFSHRKRLHADEMNKKTTTKRGDREKLSAIAAN